MNFIVDLPRTQNDFDSIFVVMNRLAMVAQFIPTMTIMTTSRVDESFFSEKFMNYGLPQEMICNRGAKICE